MRWSIIRVIWLREMRDQLRDRRTAFMIVGLPLLLYPLLGFAVLTFAMGFVEKPSVIGVTQEPLQGEDFPPRNTDLLLTALSIPVVSPGGGMPADTLAGMVALTTHPSLQYPLLIEQGKLVERDARAQTVGSLHKSDARIQFKFLSPEVAKEALDRNDIDLILSVAPGFWSRLNKANDERATIKTQPRPNDDKSRLASGRLYGSMNRWKDEFTKVHLQRQGLPGDFDHAFRFQDSEIAESAVAGIGANALFDLFVRIFPFMLVMWSLAGALYPAVDLCAGEKERGTMETLLITPAGREEIVWGKFLTIWFFSAATALLNLASMAVTTTVFGSQLPQGALPLGSLAWCVLLALPLSAFFSAISLAIGAYARSSKEGQYYLMPLFLVTMPLIFLTLAPGVKLNSFYSMVPVTGVALLMQRMMTSAGLTEDTWFYFLSVLAPTALYSWLGLRWAIVQFQREEVLFREAERLDIRLWLRNLFREKEATPTAAQAFLCFGLLLALRWLSLELGTQVPLLVRSLIVLLAFMAAPPIFMALLLTKKPWQGLSLRWPRPGYLLAALMLLPLADGANLLMRQFPGVMRLLSERKLLVEEAFLEHSTDPWNWPFYVLCLAFVSALSKELAFRGLILSGLRRRFAPWPAILISAVLFGIYHLNVFVLVPAFFLGVILGVLTWRSQSLIPAVLYHWGTYTVLILGGTQSSDFAGVDVWLRAILAVVCTPVALGLLWHLSRNSGSPTPTVPQPIPNALPTAESVTP